MRRTKKPRKRRIGLLISLVLIILVPYILVNSTPALTALFVRKLFETPIATQPAGYASYSSQVQVQHDLTYPSRYKDNRFDIYLPQSSSAEGAKSYPTIIWVHGGAYVGGDKKDLAIFSTMLASQGYVVLAMNYERAPEAKYPTPLLQLDECYQYVKANPDRFPIDTNRLFFAGDSAGAQIASNYTAIQTNSDLARQMGMEQAVPRDTIKGMLLYCGPFDLQLFHSTKYSLPVQFFLNQVAWSYIGEKNWHEVEKVKLASVVNFVTKDYPPTFITDGNKNSFEEHGRELAARLEAVNVPVHSLFFVQNEAITEHEFQFKLDTESGMKALEQSLSFLRQYASK
ncbi:alpha/beta hydrolase [Paenibacillus sp. chi10]|uniref:Alpha/beta hydrolase n=1 Tax=Paenibacillus suaedae TaxID=3077233 RepID=A0AAJ2JRM0_9BACL|nr:alpha/beta hydrolase [Paenibacillus sp. chi10]MDT8974912.1 alpha/beta hydrolase [Paenibacillus sp. chi10]